MLLHVILVGSSVPGVYWRMMSPIITEFTYRPKSEESGDSLYSRLRNREGEKVTYPLFRCLLACQ